MRESTLEQYLVKTAQSKGGECRKLRWIGRNGAPDRIVMFNGQAIFIELKAPGEKCRPHQIREHERMRSMGQRVVVVDSFEGVDEILN
jgi:hypothetical protein